MGHVFLNATPILNKNICFFCCRPAGSFHLCWTFFWPTFRFLYSWWQDWNGDWEGRQEHQAGRKWDKHHHQSWSPTFFLNMFELWMLNVRAPPPSLHNLNFQLHLYPILIRWMCRLSYEKNTKSCTRYRWWVIWIHSKLFGSVLGLLCVWSCLCMQKI